MQSAEIELKFPVADPQALQARLPHLGFQLTTPRTYEHNTLYDTPNRDLRARRQVLRIRQYGSLCTVTHKRLPDQQEPVDTTRYKIRIETETIVAEREALAAIFEQLGYGPVFVYEKYRTEWSQALGNSSEAAAHLVIDETPIGTYAELEGPTDWIDRTLAELKIDPATCLTDSYGKLFLDWKQRTASPAEHLTFADVASPVLTPH
jgi:adenylate cyclase class 2